MSHDTRQLADAVLHEGYLLYPYRASSLKNMRRFPFGTLYPEPFCRVRGEGDASSARVQCVIEGAPEAGVTVQARFLHLQTGDAAVREVSTAPAALSALASCEAVTAFTFGPLTGEVAVAAADGGGGRWTLSVDLRNTSGIDEAQSVTRDEALSRALCSALLLLHSADGRFVSAIDPPPDARALVEACRSSGLWPVLVGAPGSRHTVLAAPIILYDYPELAPESTGDFFDATEIDELLTLRILTLTDEEKAAMAECDPRGRELLARTEAAGLARLGELHGRLRSGSPLRPGMSVRLCPRAGGDVFDLALAGKRATIQALERDFEGRTYVAVTVDEDPGKDMGVHGHRFFFTPEEVEPL
ncbi:MAG TPA: hypothetical protein VEC57_12550 [Candidatus Limnocylindrales bacterium]|nr:hypothetical protein [Candidatus Limnocylindrales bacterium]